MSNHPAIRTLLLMFSPEFGAPPIALVATHRDGFPTAAEAIRAFVLAVLRTSDDPRAAPIAALATLGGFAPSVLGKQLAALNDLGWSPGEWSDQAVVVSRTDELLRNEPGGFTLREEVPGVAATITYLAATGAELATPLDLGDQKGEPSAP